MNFLQNVLELDCFSIGLSITELRRIGIKQAATNQACCKNDIGKSGW